MRVQYGFGAIALAAVLAAGCGAEPTVGPTSLAAELGSSDQLAATAGTPVVTLQSNLTVSPARVSVKAGYPVRMVNNSGRGVRVHSENCSEFSLMGLTPGASKNTIGFKPAGKTCDYFVWDTNWSRRIFVGQVVVE